MIFKKMLCFNSYCLEMKIICTYNRLHSNVDECEQRNFFKLDSRLLEFLNQFVTEEKWGEMSKEESIACSKGITLKTIRVQHQHIYSYCILHCASSHHEEQSSWPTAAGGCIWVMQMAASWHSSLVLALSERRASSTYKEATEWNITSMASTVPVEKIVQ